MSNRLTNPRANSWVSRLATGISSLLGEVPLTVTGYSPKTGFHRWRQHLERQRERAFRFDCQPPREQGVGAVTFDDVVLGEAFEERKRGLVARKGVAATFVPAEEAFAQACAARAVTSRVVPTPNGRGEVQVTSLVAGPHAAIEASEVSCVQTRSGGAAKRFW
jgi:hypothetical protein